ncbi:MAG: glycoside hydrolase family 28 protein, partial [Bacteroidales bacterium]|nr:glycoside hydrolase family 28 protein [Bacteroidales bacterium]
MKRIRIWLLALLALSASMQAKVYNMQALGADPSGKRILTKVMDKALRAVEKDGGGTLYFPAGRYLTGPIHMVDNLTIELEAGAVLSFSDNFDDYLPFVRVRYEGLFMRTFSPLFYAEGKQNLCLKGEGTLEGNGHRWWKAIGEVTA